QHRDFWDEVNEIFVCGYNPKRHADDTVLVARITSVSGKVCGTLVNYACHPTTLAWDNRLISPDYPGAMRETVEKATGAPCVFLQGASGELGPREGFVGDTAVADRNGRQLGHATLAALEALPPPGTRFEYAGPVVSGATIGTWAHRPLNEAAMDDRSALSAGPADSRGYARGAPRVARARGGGAIRQRRGGECGVPVDGRAHGSPARAP